MDDSKAVDLDWGPDLELTQTGSEFNDFLDSTARYQPLIDELYKGLGIRFSYAVPSGDFVESIWGTEAIIWKEER